ARCGRVRSSAPPDGPGRCRSRSPPAAWRTTRSATCRRRERRGARTASPSRCDRDRPESRRPGGGRRAEGGGGAGEPPPGGVVGGEPFVGGVPLATRRRVQPLCERLREA